MAKERLEASDKPSELRKFSADEIGGKEVLTLIRQETSLQQKQ